MSGPAGDLSEFYQTLDEVMRASRVISGVIAESIANTEEEVTLPQLRTLVLVAGRSGINASAVARALNIHASNATRLIDRLVHSGYLRRSESLADRRHVQLTLTRAGADLVDQVMEHRRRCYEQILGQMTAAERQTLSRALDVFSRAADESEECRWRSDYPWVDRATPDHQS